MSKIYDSIIIGAGISGLTAAKHLQKLGKSILVIDKSRGVGGRMATRRIGDRVFDHGAQFFTVRSETFATLISDALEKQIVHKWCDGFLFGDNEKFEQRKDGYPRYCGTKGMTSLAKMLSVGLDITLQERITKLSFDGEWQVEGKSTYRAKSLILTPPIPQTLELLTSISFSNKESLEEIQYNPCFAVMVSTSKPSNIPSPGGIKNYSSDIEWVGDNQQKGISPNPGITIHATAEFTEENWDMDFDQVADTLIQQVKKSITGDVIEYQVHRWRYCGPKKVYPQRCFVADELCMVVCGDAFAGPKVEGAFLSGVAAGETMERILSGATSR